MDSCMYYILKLKYWTKTKRWENEKRNRESGGRWWEGSTDTQSSNFGASVLPFPKHLFLLPNTVKRQRLWAAVHGVAKSQTWLSDFPFTFHFHALEREMATHSSVLAWRIPGTAEPGGLPSMGSHRVGHSWSDLAAAAAAAAIWTLFYREREWGLEMMIR